MWRRRGGRSHGGSLSDPSAALRPAVEAALEVARQGLLLNPPASPPAGLRRFLSFSKLSVPAVRAIAKVVDADDDFRLKVAANVDEADVGRSSWIWLTRPEGWEEELAALEAERTASAEAVAEARNERRARRKLAAAQEAAERSAESARQAGEEAEHLRAELTEARSRTAALEQEAADLRDTLTTLQDERNRAVRELKDVEARLADKAADHNRARERLRALEAEMASLGEGAGPVTPRHSALQQPASQTAAPQAAAPQESAGETTVPPLRELTEMLQEAVSGAEMVAEALARLGDQLATSQRDQAAGTAIARQSTPAGRPPSRSTEAVGPSERISPEKRQPLKLPGGVLDDTVAAADHLVRSTGVLVLVDGYNVTMTGWPDLPVAEQRAKLQRSLDGLAARTCADLEVIFDGAEVEPLHMPPPAPRDVRVRFSPPDVEADDVLLDLLAQIPHARAVVVVSSDNRVRAGARSQGANVLHAHQLLELL